MPRHIEVFETFLHIELGDLVSEVFAATMLKIMSKLEQGMGVVWEDNRHGKDFHRNVSLCRVIPQRDIFLRPLFITNNLLNWSKY